MTWTVDLSALAHPAMAYAWMAAGFGVCLYLFITAKADLRRCEKRLAAKREDLEQAVSVLEKRFEELQEETFVVREQIQLANPLRAPSSTVNFTVRSQVMRLRRRGDSAERIAAALGVGQGEVNLMLKVYDLVHSDRALTAAPIPIHETARIS